MSYNFTFYIPFLYLIYESVSVMAFTSTTHISVSYSHYRAGKK